MKHWKDDNKTRSDFHRLAYMTFHKAGLLPGKAPMSAKPWEDADYKNLMEAYRAYHDITVFETMPDAIAHIKRYAEGMRKELTHATPKVELTVQITRHYGDVSISYGMTADYLIETESQISQGFKELRDIVEAQHDLAAENRPALMPAGQAPQQVMQTGMVDVLCTHIRREFVDGKDRVRLVGGEFTKYGIPVYDEYMIPLQIDLGATPMGDSPYNKRVRVVLDAKGNPKKAIELV